MSVEPNAVEKEIKSKAKEWTDEYGEEFLLELIDVYLVDTPNRIAQLHQALDGGDTETLVREAHTLKSSSANVGALGLSALAKEMESCGRRGVLERMASHVVEFEELFAQVKATLETIRKSAGQWDGQER
jgi:two-component system sensor histidine kinase/response regulator